jgi:prostaglandin-endoperoxide synthase 2
MTNPLLAPLVYDAETFTTQGMQIIESTASLEQLVHRNVPRDSKPYVSLTRKGYRRERTSLRRRPLTPRRRS